ncbi:hypothetical protein [Haliangium ochraceum]|uniref:PE-PGRS family protein n=1 Tax=Haliangium ochraceum (strain DSM 14365 / JCM 11303 / SMP-2) TaxID=502025 RepID=D0LLY5_HALO1|nr:hypothetical protein [Haliangium ochraceum]ACY15163.1 hypothetical protein Hoch_2630 [Haliangium ochraceum DSM 14365]
MSYLDRRAPLSCGAGAIASAFALVFAAACSGGGSAQDAGPGSDASKCFLSCVGGTSLRTCTPTETLTECPLGCPDGATACNQLAPSNGAERKHLEGVDGTIDIADGEVAIFDSFTGAVTVSDANDNEITLRGALDENGSNAIDNGIGFFQLEGAALFSFRSLSLSGNGALIVDSDELEMPPTILLASDEVVLRGLINVSACCEQNAITPQIFPRSGGGLGGFSEREPATGCAPGGPGAADDGGGHETGGGGGSLGNDGAPAGNGGDGTAAGAAGVIGQDCPAASGEPLAGGSGGGLGGGVDGGPGGAGGGAIQITSLTSIVVEGSPGQFIKGILAHGGGGGPGLQSSGGGGGGSGGMILLEAPEISVTYAVLAANGGGGGGSTTSTQSGSATAGERGRNDIAQAEGGSGERAGGRGASALGRATIGEGGADGTGGGGGGTGIIRFHVPENYLTVEASTISPPFLRGNPALAAPQIERAE